MQEAGLLDLAQDDTPPVDPFGDRLADSRDRVFDGPERLPVDWACGRPAMAA